MLHIREVPGSNIDLETGYPDCFRKPLQANTGTVN
jgi:hypothetical protein